MELHFLDGGMLYELNKHYNDLGEEALINNPNLIINLYEQYISLGCNYITTCNYGFKSKKLDNWKFLVQKSVNLISCFKKDNEHIKILGCLPPYFESYYDGEIDSSFVDFYHTLVGILDNTIDEYIIETQISGKHIDKICEIIIGNSGKKINISIYPNGNITKNDIKEIINKYSNVINCILVNCCCFDDMKKYFESNIKPLKIMNYDIKFGFYCNRIDEQKYLSYTGNKTKNVSLQDFYIKRNIEKKQLNDFIRVLRYSGYKIIIGGCCGYGVKEMEDLINSIEI